MSLNIKQLPKSEIEITGEMPGEEFSKFWRKAVNELAKEVSVPGFRPGKAPEKVLIESVGEGAVLDKAAELAIRDIYPRIVEEKKLDIVGPPQATVTKITKSGPLGFKFQTAVLPEIKLSENYREVSLKIAQKKEKITVEDKEIDESLEYLRKMRAGNKAKDLPTGEEGLPELNDAFAQSVGSFKTLIELKEAIGKNIKTEKEMKGKEKKRLEILDAILKVSKLEVPDILVEGEKSKMLAEFKANISGMGMKWEDYLGHVKKKEDEILSGWDEDALRRVKYGLLLRHLGEVLKIEISDSEIDEQIKKFRVDSENVDKQKLKDYSYGIIRNEKIFKLLESN